MRPGNPGSFKYSIAVVINAGMFRDDNGRNVGYLRDETHLHDLEQSVRENRAFDRMTAS